MSATLKLHDNVYLGSIGDAGTSWGIAVHMIDALDRARHPRANEFASWLAKHPEPGDDNTDQWYETWDTLVDLMSDIAPEGYRFIHGARWTDEGTFFAWIKEEAA